MESDEIQSVGIGSGLKTHTLELHNPTKLDVQSSESSVLRVKACLLFKDKEREVGSFVVKTFKSKDSRDAHLNHYLYLKNNGYPVPTICRPINDLQLLVNDLSLEGENIIFSLNSQMGGYRDVNLKNKESIKQQLRAVAEKADTEGIRLSADAFFLVIDQQGNGNISIGDFGGIFISEEEKQRDTGYKDTKEATDGFWNIINSNFSAGANFTPVYDEEP